jgi:hypothetical protein
MTERELRFGSRELSFARVAEKDGDLVQLKE